MFTVAQINTARDNILALYGHRAIIVAARLEANDPLMREVGVRLQRMALDTCNSRDPLFRAHLAACRIRRHRHEKRFQQELEHDRQRLAAFYARRNAR